MLLISETWPSGPPIIKHKFCDSFFFCSRKSARLYDENDFPFSSNKITNFLLHNFIIFSVVFLSSFIYLILQSAKREIRFIYSAIPSFANLRFGEPTVIIVIFIYTLYQNKDRLALPLWLFNIILTYMYLLFKDIKESDKNIAINSLINESTPKPAFFFLIILSVVMATCGLIINNISVVIASMLIAPILSPILATALGVSVADNSIIKRSLKTLGKSALYAIAISALTTLALWQFTVGEGGAFNEVFNSEILSRTQPTIVYFFIAIVAGLTTAFARMKPELNEALPGTAIAIALVPPLATIGIGVATLNLSVISGALSMFVLNSIGIVLAALVVFSLMDIRSKKKTVKRAEENAEKEQEKVKEEFEEEKLEERIKKEKITHKMQLEDDAFNKIKSNEKTIEIRILDNKIKKLKVDDVIIFSKKTDSSEKIVTNILNLTPHDNFSSLINGVNMKELGYEENYKKEKLLKSIYKIYTKEQELEYGALAIQIRIIKPSEFID